MKNILINSLLIILVMLVYFFVLKAIEPKLLFHLYFGLIITTIVFLIFLVLVGLQERKKAGGFLGFGEAIIATYTTYGLSTLVYSFIFFLIISSSPELIDIASESSSESIRSVLEMTGMSEDEIALKLEEQDPLLIQKSLTISATLTSWFSGLIFPGLIYVLIASFIVKKTAPLNT